MKFTVVHCVVFIVCRFDVREVGGVDISPETNKIMPFKA